MTGSIFEEFLCWFDRRMIGRSVVLILDRLSTNEVAVRTIESSDRPLQNTFLMWLPASFTSKFWPLDKGIIWSWKAHWRRQWLRFLADEVGEDRNPLATMNILKAVRWGIQSWELDITPETITECFDRVLTGSSSRVEYSQSVEVEIRRQLCQLQDALVIRQAMDLSDFVNPVEKAVEDRPEDIDRQIIAPFFICFGGNR
jgi:hypothetical protein